MATQRYYPPAEGDQVTWLNNYLVKIPIHGPTCGLADGEVEDTVADLTYLIWVIGTWYPIIKQDGYEATAYKRMVAFGPGSDTVPLPVASIFPTVTVTGAVGPNTPAATLSTAAPAPDVRPVGVLNRLFNQVGRIKMSAGYTDAIGQDLQIVGVEDATAHPVPEYALAVEQGAGSQSVRLDFTKFNHQGVHIESRRNNGAWEFLGVDTEKPYQDERPLLVANAPEVREYRLRFWDKGKPNGDWSPVQKVTVAA